MQYDPSSKRIKGREALIEYKKAKRQKEDGTEKSLKAPGT